MKILHINTFDVGGAAKACFRLHKAMLERGLDSNVLTLYGNENVKNKIFVFRKKEVKSLFPIVSNRFKSNKNEKAFTEQKAFLKKRSQKLELYSFPDSPYNILESPIYKECNIVNLHWVSNFMDYKSFIELNSKYLFWTLHDINPFSGGEHYNEIYEGLDDRNKPVKRLKSEQEQVFDKRNFEIKKQALSKTNNLHLITLSKWMQDQTRNSKLFNSFPTTNIPNNIETNIYKPRDKEYSRKIFDLPQDKTIVLFVAETVQRARKGFSYMLQALKKLNKAEIHFFVIGRLQEPIENENITCIDYIHDDLLLSIAYSAADVFIIPSILDNLPNTVIESLSCGTPVIGFPNGGIPDMIIDNKNGMLCKDTSVDALIEKILDFVNSNSFNRNRISEDAHKLYDPDKQVDSYLSLYESVLKS